MNQTPRNPGLDQLDVLSGEWEVQSVIDGEQVGLSCTRFDWTQNGAFLMQTTGDPSEPRHAETEWEANAPDSVTMLIGLDDTNDGYSALYADSRGVYRVYQMKLDSRTWTLHRNAPGFSQRFIGEISADGETINGRWEASEDGRTWAFDFDLIYTKKR